MHLTVLGLSIYLGLMAEFAHAVYELDTRWSCLLLQCGTNLSAMCCFTGKEMTRSSTWWDASPSSQRARKTCCSGTARMTSASCIQPARTVRSSGWGQLRSSIMVLLLKFSSDRVLLWQHYVKPGHVFSCEKIVLFPLLVISSTFFFIFSDCRPNCKVDSLNISQCCCSVWKLG